MTLNCPHYSFTNITMQFSLPHALQQELLSYDPDRKHLAVKKKTDGNKTKPKFPLGKIAGLIPEDIVSIQEFDEAVEYINSQPAPSRYKVFRTNNIVTGILVYFENVWYAWWLPQVKDTDYIFGYAYAYKNTPSSIAKCPRTITENTNYITEIQCGKSKFIRHQRYINIDYLKSISDSTRNTLLKPVYFQRFHEKSSRIYDHALQVFEQQLFSTIPHWTDASHPFERLLATSVVDVAKHKIYFLKHCKELTVVELINQIKLSNKEELISNDITAYKDILRIIDTPFFRSWIQNKFDKSTEQFKTATEKQDIIKPLKQIEQLFAAVLFINRIWLDCPVDYYRTHINAITEMQYAYTSTTYEKAIKWFGTNMPVASFFNILTKLHETQRQWSSINERFVFSIYEFTDCIRMLQQLLDNNIEVTPPKRWRLTEFHDYLMSETWKIRNENIKLPQDLFPEPVNTAISGTKLTFFQPIDTHQLSQWGQTVRNCVGSSNNYANGIKKKLHFIVLGMVDNKPHFTVQLKLRNGVLNVEQIKSICNKALTSEEETMYSMGFTDALHKRNAELQSAT